MVFRWLNMKWGVFILILIISALFTASCACASDVNDTLAMGDDAKSFELSQIDEIGASDESQTNDDKPVAETDSDVSSDDVGTWSGLSEEIKPNETGVKNLSHKYYRYDEGTTISITASCIIDGQGAVIDMAGSDIQPFRVSESSVTFRNLTIKNAHYGDDGGAIYFVYTAKSYAVENCNFTNNSAGRGGVIYIEYGATGTIENCKFANNKATSKGGAIYFRGEGNVVNCNFTNNHATGEDSGGGAIFMNLGTVENCNFNNSSSDYGGAIYFNGKSSAINCKFTNNQATREGGAIYFYEQSTVTNCNFTDNAASRGSAIYFYNYITSNELTISDSTFLNNRANMADNNPLKTTINENTITITFTGQNNLLNAIYSRNDVEVSLTNVAYWGANGITNTGNSPIKPSRTNKEAGQNITVRAVVNGELVLDEVKVTDENGTVILDISVDESYYISVRHDEDSYYTEAEKVSTNMHFYVKVAEIKTNNRTVNITAKSNINNEVMPGELHFVLPSGSQINANYASNGIWWVVHTFDDYADYQVNASYIGLDNVAITNANISITRANSTVNVSDVVLDYGDSKNVTVIAQGATGITAWINDKSVSVINKFTIPISGLDAGTYNLTVITKPDGDHNSVRKTVKITVNKVNSTINVTDVEMDYGTSVDVDIETVGTTEITAEIDGTSVGVAGYAVHISGLKAGIHNLTVTAKPDGNHNSINKTVKITVKRINSTINVNDIEMTYGSSLDVPVETVGASGITAEIDGNAVGTTGNIISISGLTAGTHYLTITTKPDENHTAITETVNITVIKANSTISINDTELDYGTSVEVPFETSGADGITAEIDGNAVEAVDSVIPISGLTAGIHNLTVTTNPDTNHNSTNKTVKITVNKVNSTINVTDVEMDYGTSVDVSVETVGAVGITAEIDGTPVGVAGYSVPVSGLNAGIHNLTVTTMPDDNHNSTNKTVKITVKKTNSTINLNDIEMDYGTSVDVDIETEGTTGITAEIDGVPVGVVGYAVPISGLTVGIHNLTVTTKPDDNHNSTNKTVKITVKKVNSTINLNDIEMVYGTSVDVSVETVGAVGITAEIDGNAVETIGNMIPISGLTAGTHHLTITTKPDANHYSVNKTVNIAVNKISLIITATDNAYIINYGGKYSVTVNDANGKVISGVKVTFTLNGKNIASVTTNAQGIATITLTANMLKAAKAGNRNLVIALENEMYQAIKTVKITVNKEKTKIVAKMKTFKKANKVKKYTITLKNSKNKAVKKVTVTLKIKGKTYNAKTNAKGKAFFKINKLTNKGTFKATVKFKGNSYYKAVTKKVKIKIK